MGSIAGDLSRPWDCSYVHRFFIWTDPSEPFRISRVALQMCDKAGADLLTVLEQQDGKSEEEVAYNHNEATEVRDLIAKFGVDTYSLHRTAVNFAETEDRFWGRTCYESPPLIRNRKITEGAKKSL